MPHAGSPDWHQLWGGWEALGNTHCQALWNPLGLLLRTESPIDHTISILIILSIQLGPSVARLGSVAMGCFPIPVGNILGCPSSSHHPLSLPAETTSTSTSSFMPPPTTKICDKGAGVGSGAVAVCWTAGLVLAAYGVLFI